MGTEKQGRKLLLTSFLSGRSNKQGFLKRTNPLEKNLEWDSSVGATSLLIYNYLILAGLGQEKAGEKQWHT